MQTKTSYSGAQIALHWGIALLIVLNYFISEGMAQIFDGSLAGRPVAGFLPAFHVYAGVTVLGLVLLRLALRLGTGAPETTGAKTLMDRAAGWSHGLLYVLMVAVPALGAITWYGGIAATADLHVLALNAMMLLIAAHAAAALFHQYFLRDGLLLRMIRPD